MENMQESTVELKRYLRKLVNLIENDAIFLLLKTKIVDKKKVDDILCCIEASWPEDYKAYLDKYGQRKLKSNQYYSQLLAAVKNRFLFSTNVYSVRSQEALQLINAILNTIDSDINVIIRTQEGNF